MIGSILSYDPEIVPVEDYETLLVRGSDVCRQSRVVIAGLIRNASPYLHRLQRIVYSIAKLFGDYHIVLYENDSEDCTVNDLKQWSLSEPCLHFVSEKLDKPNFGSVLTLERMQFMVDCRNHYLQYIDDHHYWNADYVIVLDTDIQDIYTNGLVSSLGMNGWDCVTSNGVDKYENLMIYYDIAPLVIRGFVKNANIPLPLPNAVIRVDSAFGGMAVYRYSSLSGKRYETGMMPGDHCAWHPDIRPMCDHIGLNMQLENVWVNSRQIVIR